MKHSEKPIYLDYNATTPIDPGVRDVMLPYVEEYFGGQPEMVISILQNGLCLGNEYQKSTIGIGAGCWMRQ